MWTAIESIIKVKIVKIYLKPWIIKRKKNAVRFLQLEMFLFDTRFTFTFSRMYTVHKYFWELSHTKIVWQWWLITELILDRSELEMSPTHIILIHKHSLYTYFNFPLSSIFISLLFPLPLVPSRSLSFPLPLCRTRQRLEWSILSRDSERTITQGEDACRITPWQE